MMVNDKNDYLYVECICFNLQMIVLMEIKEDSIDNHDRWVIL